MRAKLVLEVTDAGFELPLLVRKQIKMNYVFFHRMDMPTAGEPVTVKMKASGRRVYKKSLFCPFWLLLVYDSSAKGRAFQKLRHQHNEDAAVCSCYS